MLLYQYTNFYQINQLSIPYVFVTATVGEFGINPQVECKSFNKADRGKFLAVSIPGLTFRYFSLPPSAFSEDSITAFRKAKAADHRKAS